MSGNRHVVVCEEIPAAHKKGVETCGGIDFAVRDSGMVPPKAIRRENPMTQVWKKVSGRSPKI